VTDWFEPWQNVRWDPTLPPDRRRQVIRRYAATYPLCRIFVETGTADGQTTRAVCDLFDHAYTIELGPRIFHQYAPALRSLGNVTPMLGDSAAVLPGLLAGIDSPCLFWLDGHFCSDVRGSKDTPIGEELEIIFGTNRPHVVLIDDARLFGNHHVFPTVDWVRNFATTQSIRFDFGYLDDIMRITPR